MAGGSKESSSIIEEMFQNLQQAADKLRQQQAGLTEEDAKKEAIKKIREKAKRKENTKLEKEYSADYVKRVSGKDGVQVKLQQERMSRAHVYSKESLTHSMQDLELIKSAIPDSVPKYIDVTKIQNNAAVAEYAKRMALLSPDLQKDPNVIIRETTRLYHSIEWTSAALTREAYKEAMDTINASFAEAQKLAHAQGIPNIPQGIPLTAMIDSRTDLYRTKQLEALDPTPTGEPPKDNKGKIKKDSKDFNNWVNTRTEGNQNAKLHETMQFYQEQLDRNDGDPKRQEEILRELAGKIRRYSTESMKVTDADYGVEYTIKTGVNPAKAQIYLDETYTLQTRTNKIIENDKQIADQAEYKQRLEESGGGIEYSKELSDIFQNPERKVGQVYQGHHQFSAAEWEMFKKGSEGWVEYTVGMLRQHTFWDKDYELNLADQNKWESAKNIMSWLGGEKQTQFIEELDTYVTKRYSIVDKIIRSVDAPGKKKFEEFTTAMRYLDTQLLEWLRMTENTNIAKPHYRSSIEYFMSLDKEEYYNALNHLLSEREGNNPFIPDNRITNNEFIDIVYFAEFNPKNDHYRAFHALSPEQQQALRNEKDTFLREVDRVGDGILLRDVHMRFHENAYKGLKETQLLYTNKHGKLLALEPNDPRRVQLQRELDDLNTIMQKQWYEVTHNKNSNINPLDRHTVEAINGLSPVEIETRDQLIKQRRMELSLQNPSWTEDELTTNLQKEEWKIYQAVWAAKSLSIGTGEAVDIAGKLSHCASKDIRFKLNRQVEHGDGKQETFSRLRVQSFMNRGWAEAWTRGDNPNLFEDDFSMGGAVGDDQRDIYYSTTFEMWGYDWRKDKDITDVYREKLENAKENGVPEWVILSEYAQDVLGLSYSEIVRPELLVTGLQNKSTSWRYEKSALDVLRDLYLDKLGSLPEGSNIEHHALGLRLLAARSDEERTVIMKRMLRRTPSEFINLIDGGDLRKLAETAGFNLATEPGKREWHNFQKALSIAELELVLNDKYKYHEFDFTAVGSAGQRKHFDQLMPGALKAVGLEPTDQLLNKSFNVLIGVRNYMESAPGIYTSGRGNTRLERWVNHKFKNIFILGLGIDWQKDVDFTKLDSFALERRINDQNSQNRAEDIRRDIFYGHPEAFFYPAPGKEKDAILKLKEFQDTVNFYTGAEDAENAMSAVLQTIIKWNRNQAIAPAKWMPGMVTLFKSFPGINVSQEVAWDWIGKKFTGLMGRSEKGREFAEKYNLANVPTRLWPKSLKELSFVSYDVKHGGAGANAWDEFKIAGVLETVEELKMFSKTGHSGHRALYDLKQKFHTTAGWRLLATARKYWWVVPVATIATAAMASYEEEKKKDGSHGH